MDEYQASDDKLIFIKSIKQRILRKPLSLVEI